MKSIWSCDEPGPSTTQPVLSNPISLASLCRVASSHRRRWWREVPHPFVDSADHAAGPDRQYEANQARALVLAALQQVPLPRRAVLVMHDLDQVPVQEIAAELSIPLFTAYSRLRKARVELQIAITRLQRRSVPR
jgi:RNA polymerase sigma-70 factor, ECF subfamily